MPTNMKDFLIVYLDPNGKKDSVVITAHNAKDAKLSFEAGSPGCKILSVTFYDNIND